MNTRQGTTGAALAAAAAALLLAGCATGPMKTGQAAKVHCAGINACKGQTACKSARNDCKGKNSCKGQGWKPAASAEACQKLGGTVI